MQQTKLLAMSEVQLSMVWSSLKFKNSVSMVVLTVIRLVVLMTWDALWVIVSILALVFSHGALKKLEVTVQSIAEAEYIIVVTAWRSYLD